MKLDNDNYRLTAYVLDELSPREKARIGKAIEADPELRKEIDALRQATDLMNEVASLEAASSLLLDEEGKAAVEEALAELGKMEKAEKVGRGRREPSPIPWWLQILPPQQWAPLGTAMLVLGIGYIAFKDIVVFKGVEPRQSFQEFKEPMAVRLDPEMLHEDESRRFEAKNEAGGRAGEIAEEMPVLIEEEPSDYSGGVMKLETGIPKEQIEGTPMPIRLPGSTTAGLSADSSRRSQSGRDSRIKDQMEGFYEVRPSRKFATNAEGYAPIDEKGFTRVIDAESATSTFSADVDTASYSNIRRFLNQGQLPPVDAVRIEELVNYFTYDYREPSGKHPFGAEVEIAACPWQPEHRLARIGIRAASLDADERPPMNLVFLIDVSGSMRPGNKLPLLKRSMQTLVKNLNEEDRVAIVTYAGNSGLVLESTPASDRQKILAALENLRSGGSTAGASGIKLAYEVARQHSEAEAMNRVILCTDGDFNVGTTDNDELVSLIRARRNDGIFLNIYGFGMGNIKDDRLEKLSNEGNGTYGYIDNYQEAQKVFGEQLEGTLATVAKDVKFQLEFNPQAVAAYRLIGYENRRLAREDFNDDTKDAGEVGAGHTVTALYEIVPVGVKGTVADVDPHRYIEEGESGERKPSLLKRLIAGRDEELFFLKIRYKQPDADTSELMTLPVKDSNRSIAKADSDFRFAAAVAGFGQLLRGSRHAGELEWSQVIEMARGARGEDTHGHRAGFIRLAETAQDLQK